MKTLPQTALFLFCAILLIGCASTPDNSNNPDTGDSHDTSADARDGRIDGRDTVEAHDADEDTTNTIDSGMDAVAYDPTPWQNDPGSCGPPKTFEPVSSESFSKPDNPDLKDESTKEEFWNAVGRSTLQATSIRANNDLEPTQGFDHTTIYADSDEDAVFHLYALNNYDDLSSFQISVTAMVNYEPVEATYIRVSGDRQNEIERFDNVTGMEIQADRKVELVDIHIPASAFVEGQMNEVSIALQTHTVKRRPVYQFNRFSLFYGGWERPDKPCIHAAKAMESLPPEDKMHNIFSFSTAFAFFGEFENALEFRKRREVAPGETVRIYISLRAWERPRDFAMVPILDGKPMGPIWWTEQSLHDESNVYRNIDARRYIDVTMPEELGVYNFQVVTWPDPYEIRNFPDGTDTPSVKTTLLHRGSNHLTFEVTE